MTQFKKKINSSVLVGFGSMFLISMKLILIFHTVTYISFLNKSTIRSRKPLVFSLLSVLYHKWLLNYINGFVLHDFSAFSKEVSYAD